MAIKLHSWCRRFTFVYPRMIKSLQTSVSEGRTLPCFIHSDLALPTFKKEQRSRL